MFTETEIVLVHYRVALPTIVTLNALFSHYPEQTVTIVDNSAGECPAQEAVSPHLTHGGEQIRLLENPAAWHSPPGLLSHGGPLSHGGGIDYAVQNSEAKYIITIESDTFITARGGFERLTGLMENGFDWAGFAQKPFGNEFGSFSPSFAIFRTDLVKAYELSFCRRPRGPEDYSEDDIINRHHLLAAEQVQLGLPLTYPEGKPPDTYKMEKNKIARRELDHLHYFDTAEYMHHFLKNRGYRYHLFRPDHTVCHIWGSRDQELFLTHFKEKFPDVDLKTYLPPGYLE